MEQRLFNDISYERFLSEGKLMGSKCRKCGALFLPPRPLCVQCYSTEMEWVQMKGRGKLVAFTCIAVGPPDMMREGYNRKNPYVCGVVELEEGVKVVARIQGVNGAQPETIKVGMPLQVEFLQRKEDNAKSVLAFRPA
jgi:uncharacterized OB-fold protein